MRGFLRGLLAVVAGYLPVAVLMMVGFLILNAVWPTAKEHDAGLATMVLIGCVAGAVGGYVAAWVGGRRGFLHATILGVLMMAAGILTVAIPNKEHAPAWFGWGISLLAFPVAVVGGWMRVRTRARTVETLPVKV